MESFVVPTSWIQWYTLQGCLCIISLICSVCASRYCVAQSVLLVVLNEYVCHPQLMVLLFMVYTARLLQQVPARHSILHLLQVN
jgi:uncharacterized membrane protein